jgi:hypothetical protein
LTGKPFSKRRKKWLRNTTRNINSISSFDGFNKEEVGPAHTGGGHHSHPGARRFVLVHSAFAF